MKAYGPGNRGHLLELGGDIGEADVELLGGWDLAPVTRVVPHRAAQVRVHPAHASKMGRDTYLIIIIIITNISRAPFFTRAHSALQCTFTIQAYKCNTNRHVDVLLNQSTAKGHIREKQNVSLKVQFAVTLYFIKI